MGANDRLYFHEAIKTRTFTVDQIAETYDVSKRTARNWVNKKEFEVVPLTWPFEYRLVGSDIPSQQIKDVVVTPTETDHSNCLRGMPIATDAQKQQMLDTFLDGEITWEVGEKLRSIDSPDDLDKFIATLKSVIVTAQYYQNKLR
jgi:hypothetical protein